MGLGLISNMSGAYDAYLQTAALQMGVSLATFTLVLTIISLWSLIWKGFALWKSAKKNSPIWFIVLLVVNTMGILEILYIFVFSKMGSKKQNSSSKKKQ